MRKSRFSEEQIIALLKEQEAGRSTAEVCRRHGISQPTFYAWKSQFGGLEVSDAKRLKALEEENRKLKKQTFGATPTSRQARRCEWSFSLIAQLP